MVVMFGMEAHPIADIFPMLEDEELEELADDIKERGLLHPIVLDQEGQILDGRNRLSACNLAGVEPHFTTYEGDDPGGYALATNINRRHLTKGQQAMIVVKVGGLYNLYNQTQLARNNGLHRPRLNEAQSILYYAPDLVDDVISGKHPLDAALVATAGDADYG